ncbi:hypothetical protein Dimus_030116, partial [Dionaea muscipula]
IGVKAHKRVQRRISAAEDGENDDDNDNDDHDSGNDGENDGHDSGNNGHQPSAPEKVQTSSVNAAEVVDNDDEKEDDVVDSGGQETRAAEGQGDENQDDDQESTGSINDEADPAVSVEPADIAEKNVIDFEDDDEDNIPLSSSVKTLRKGNEDDEDNVPLSLNDTDLEVVGVHPAEVEVEVEDNSLLVVGEDGELYGIDDVDAYTDIVHEKNYNDIFKDISENVDMELAEEVVKQQEDKEVAKKVVASKSKTFKRRKTAKRSKIKRKLVVKSDKEEEVEAVDSPKDDVVLTTSRDTDEEVIWEGNCGVSRKGETILNTMRKEIDRKKSSSSKTRSKISQTESIAEFMKVFKERGFGSWCEEAAMALWKVIHYDIFPNVTYITLPAPKKQQHRQQSWSQ